jgi:hypothetical protein
MRSASFRGFQGLDHDILAFILEAKSGFEQPRPDLAGAEPGEFGAIEIDHARPPAHVLDADPQPIGQNTLT